MTSAAVNKMCTSKKAYRYELAAIRAAINSSTKFGKPFRVYHCPICHAHHITSSVKD